MTGPRAFSLFLTLGLAACVTPGPTTQFYLLTPSAQEQPLRTPSREATRTVVIKDIRLPAYLDRPQIVTRTAGNRLEWSELQQWGGPLRDELARLLALNLGAQLDGLRIVAAPFPASQAPDARLEVDIRRFERQPDGRIELIAQWWLTKGADGTLLASGNEALIGEQAVDTGDYDGISRAMSDVYDRFARTLAEHLRPAAAKKR